MPIGFCSGSISSSPPRGIGKKKQNGSSFSKRIRTPGAVNFQFMVKLATAPIGLDHTGQSLNAVLGTIDRAGDPQIDLRAGAEEAQHVKGQHALAEMAHNRGEIAERRQRRDLDTVQRIAAGPFRIERDRGQDFPTMRIGDDQR